MSTPSAVTARKQEKLNSLKSAAYANDRAKYRTSNTETVKYDGKSVPKILFDAKTGQPQAYTDAEFKEHTKDTLLLIDMMVYIKETFANPKYDKVYVGKELVDRNDVTTEYEGLPGKAIPCSNAYGKKLYKLLEERMKEMRMIYKGRNGVKPESGLSTKTSMYGSEFVTFMNLAANAGRFGTKEGVKATHETPENMFLFPRDQSEREEMYPLLFGMGFEGNFEGISITQDSAFAIFIHLYLHINKLKVLPEDAVNIQTEDAFGNDITFNNSGCYKSDKIMNEAFGEIFAELESKINGQTMDKKGKPQIFRKEAIKMERMFDISSALVASAGQSNKNLKAKLIASNDADRFLSTVFDSEHELSAIMSANKIERNKAAAKVAPKKASTKKAKNAKEQAQDALKRLKS